MKKQLSFINPIYILYFAIVLFSFVYALNIRAVYFTDTASYTDMTLIRGCGYPFFIYFIKLVFGSTFDFGVVFLQTTINLFSVAFLLRCLRKTIHLNSYFLSILSFFLIFPIFFGSKLGSIILSESLAYPLYLAVIGNLIVAMLFKQNRPFYYAIVLTLIVILVRGQFLFLVPAIVIAVILAYYKNLFRKEIFFLILAVGSIPIVAVGADISYHKLKHHYAVATPLTGIQISTIPFFVSDEKDSLIFQDKQQQHYFNCIYKSLKEKHLLASQVTQSAKRIDSFAANYVEICNHTLDQKGVSTFDAKLSPNEKIIGNNKITTAMTLPLLKDNFKKCLAIYTANFMKGFDTSKYFLIYTILLILNLVLLFKKENVLSKFFILLIFLMIGNVLIVSVAEAIIARYTFYNNWILIAFILILFQYNFYPKANE